MKTNLKLFSLFLLVGLLGALVSGCTANITRNADGSLTVETSMTAESLQVRDPGRHRRSLDPEPDGTTGARLYQRQRGT